MTDERLANRLADLRSATDRLREAIRSPVGLPSTPWSCSMLSSNVLPATADPLETRTGIAAFVRDALVRLVRGYRLVERAALYGSRARGDFARYSDIDIALFGDAVTASDIAAIRNAIDDSFIVFPVDVVAVNALPVNGSMRRTIDRDGIVIYDRTSDPSAVTAR